MQPWNWFSKYTGMEWGKSPNAIGSNKASLVLVYNLFQLRLKSTPSSLTSLNPAEIMMKAFTPFSANMRTDSGQLAAGIASTAKSAWTTSLTDAIAEMP
jgi:hypothetical protein